MAQVIVTQLVVDASGAQRGVAEFEAAMAKAKKSANDSGDATASAFDRAQQRWTQSLARTDPLIRAQIKMQQDLERQQRVNADAVKLGIATQEAANAQLDRVRLKHEQNIVKVRESTVEYRAQQKAIEGTANAMGSIGNAVSSLRAKYDPLYAAGQRYKQTLLEIRAASEAGILAEDKAAAAINRTKAAFTAQVGAITGNNRVMQQARTHTGALGGSMSQLSFQINDVVSGVLMGQAPFQIFAQQGGQIFQVWQMNNNIFKELAGLIGRGLVALFTSLWGAVALGVVALGGLIAATLSYESSVRKLDIAIAAHGNRLGLTAQGYRGLTADVAHAADVSVKSSREIVTAFVNTNTGTAAIKTSASIVRDWAAVTGKNAVDAAKDLASILKDPTAAAKRLADEYGLLNAASLRQIEDLQQQGRVWEAQAVLADKMKDRVHGLRGEMSLLSQIFSDAKNGVSAFFDGLGGYIDGLLQSGKLQVLALALAPISPTYAIKAYNYLDQKRLDQKLAPVTITPSITDIRNSDASQRGKDLLDSLDPYSAQLRKVNNELKGVQDGYILVENKASAVALLEGKRAEILQSQKDALARQNKSYTDIKQTFDGFLSALSEAARLQGVSRAEQEKEAAVIKGARIDQRAHNVAVRDLVTTYKAAVDVLGEQRAGLVEVSVTQGQMNALTLQDNEQLQIANAALGANRDARDLIVAIKERELSIGRDLTDQEKARMKLNQAANDNVRLKEYIEGQRDEVRLAGLSADERERQAAILQAMHITHGALRLDQANEITQMVSLRQEAAKLASVTDGISGGFEKFFSDVLSGGKDAFKSLADTIKSYFIQLLAWMAARAIAQPIIVPMVASLGGALGLGGAASLLGGGGVGGALGGLSSLGSLGALGGAGGLLGGVGSFVSGGLNSIGSALGFGSTATGALGESVFLPGSSSVLGSATLGGALGGAGIGALTGSIVSSLGLGKSTGSSIGGALGGAVGSIIPGIGTIVGSLAGSLIGGLFGPGKSAGHAVASFDQNYNVTGIGGDKRTTQSAQAVQSAAQSVAAVAQTLQAAGVSLASDVSQLVISDNRDKSFIRTTSGQEITVGNVGDANSAISGALDYILKGASASDANVAQVLKSYQGHGGITQNNYQQFASDVDFAKQLANLDFTKKSLTQTEQTLAAISDQFNTAIDRAKTLGLDTANITQARDGALAQVTTGFNQSMTAALAQLTNPVLAQWNTLIDAENARVNEAKAANADLTLLEKLNAKERESYIANLTADQRASLQGLSDATLNLALSAANAQSALAALAKANDVNATNQQAIDQLLNPTLAAWNKLLAEQAMRAKDAASAGADTILLERRAELERADFLRQLTVEQRAAFTGLLDLAGQLSAKVADVQQRALSLVDTQISAANSFMSASRQLAQTYQGIAQQLAQSRNGLLVGNLSALSPRGQYGAARDQLNAALSAGRSGDTSALQSLPGLAQSFLTTSRDFNGANTVYGADFARVQDILKQAEGLSTSRADSFTQLADLAQTQIDVLGGIKDELSKPSPDAVFLQAQIAKLEEISNSTYDTVDVLLSGFTAQITGLGFVSDSTVAGANIAATGFKSQIDQLSKLGYTGDVQLATLLGIMQDSNITMSVLQNGINVLDAPTLRAALGDVVSALGQVPDQASWVSAATDLSGAPIVTAPPPPPPPPAPVVPVTPYQPPAPANDSGLQSAVDSLATQVSGLQTSLAGSNQDLKDAIAKLSHGIDVANRQDRFGTNPIKP